MAKPLNDVLEIAQRLAAAGCKMPHPQSKVASERMLNLSVLFDYIGNIAAAGCFKSLAEEVAELEKLVAGNAAYRAALTRAAEICEGKVVDRMNAFDNGCWSCAEAIRVELALMPKPPSTPPSDGDFYALLTEFEQLVLDANDSQLPRRAQLPVTKRLNEVRAKLQVFGARSEKARISDARIKELVRNVFIGINCPDVSASECIEHAIRTAVEEDRA
jgi:hypothetical protein